MPLKFHSDQASTVHVDADGDRVALFGFGEQFANLGMIHSGLLRLFLDGSGQAAISALGGMGGVGKTTLAVHVAHKLKVHYPEAQIFVDLQGTSESPISPEAAMGKVILSFEPQVRLPDSAQEVTDLYRSLLANRRTLLLLDNAANATQVRDLLLPPPAATIITSRRTIILPGLTSLNLEVMFKAEAMDLFRTILGNRRAADEEIAVLTDRCGCLPLALRAAGSFLATHPDWDVGEYLEVLAQEKERLRRLKHEDLEVEAALGLSAAMLTRKNPEWAGRWQTLTVFPASFKRGGAAAVWQVETEEARDTLGELLIRSLVLYDSETGRYRLHDLMRLVARNAFGYGGAVPDTAADQARLARAAANHAVYYEKMLRESNALYEQGGEAMGLGLELFDGEWDNIRAGQAWVATNAKTDPGATQLCDKYADAGAYLFSLRMHPRDWISWLEAALASARRLENRPNEVGHLGNLGIAYIALGEYRRAIEFNKQVLAISREMGRRRVEGKALINLAIAYSNLGESHLAINYLEQSLLNFQQMGDRQGEGMVLGNLGKVYANLEEYGRAIEFYEQAHVIFQEIGDRQEEGNAWWNMSLALDTGGTAAGSRKGPRGPGDFRADRIPKCRYGASEPGQVGRET